MNEEDMLLSLQAATSLLDWEMPEHHQELREYLVNHLYSCLYQLGGHRNGL